MPPTVNKQNLSDHNERAWILSVHLGMIDGILVELLIFKV